MLQCFPCPSGWRKPQTMKERFIKIVHYIYKKNTNLTIVQFHIWGFLIGIIGGLFVYIYQQMLKYMLKFLWDILPGWLYHDVHFFSQTYFPPYNYIWMLALVASIILGVSLVICERYSFLRTPGSVGDMIAKLHYRGFVGAHHFIPMWFLSLLSLSSGASVGPEAPMTILGAGIGGKIGRWLKQDVSHLRVLSICGMSATLSAFFGLPLGGALFVLEMPHRWGLQYYEAISPAIVSSLIGVATRKALDGEPFGGEFFYPIVGEIKVYHMFQGVVIGILGAIIGSVWSFITYNLKHKAQDLRKLYPVHGTIFLTIIGGILGAVIGMVYPLTLFWGEATVQTILSRGETETPRYPAYMGSLLQYWDINGVPFSASTLFQVGIFKIISTAIHVSAGYPAGVIYPLFYIGCVWGYAFSLVFDWYPTLCVLGMMGAVEVAITRCPWATVFVLLQSQGGFFVAKGMHEAVPLSGKMIGDAPVVSETHYLSVLPVMTTAVVTSLLLTRYMVYYPEQKNRKEHPFKEKLERDAGDDFDDVEDFLVNPEMAAANSDSDLELSINI